MFASFCFEMTGSAAGTGGRVRCGRWLAARALLLDDRRVVVQIAHPMPKSL